MTIPATIYKLTDEHGRSSYGDTQWREGITHSGTGEGELCSSGWIHAYTDPLLAVLLNPIHADFKHPLLWECSWDGAYKTEMGLKIGVQHCTTVRQITIPAITKNRRTAFAILCAMQVHDGPSFKRWAAKWLNGEDRSRKSAVAAEAAAEAAARAAWAAAEAAAEAAAWAAWAAAEAAAWAWAAAEAAAEAWAAWAAAKAKHFDLAAIAHEAMEYKA